jgi:hypothetical protein
MNLIKSAIVATALSFALATGAAAQTPPAPATTTTVKPVTPPTATATTPSATTPSKTSKVAKTPAKPRTEASIQCSKDADAKSLHGTERKKFREACMKAKPKT